MTYEEAKEKFAKARTDKGYRLPGVNTYLVKTSGGYGVKYHDTVVVDILPDRYVLDSGGYRTATTKNRMNEYLEGFYVWQEKGVWYVSRQTDDWRKKKCDYVDGISLCLDESISVPKGARSVKEEKALRKRIKKYTKAYIEALVIGNVPAPSNGDCFYCLMRDVESDVPIGELNRDTGHLLDHFRESYYVPSLLVRAVEVYPVSPFAREYLACYFQLVDPSTVWRSYADIAQKQLEKSLRRYLYRQFGLVDR